MTKRATDGIMVTPEDIRERKRVERELSEKSATLIAVTHALNCSWKAATGARRASIFLTLRSADAKRIRISGCGAGGPVLRVLAHDGIVG